MYSSVSYSDLYEEFLQLTSSQGHSTSENQQPHVLQAPPIRTDTLENSSLRAITPPSPTLTSYAFPATTFLSLVLETDTDQVVGMSSDDVKMCDSSKAKITPNIVTPDSSTEKQLPMESNRSSQCNEHSTYFQNSPYLPVVSSSGNAGMHGVLQQNLQHHSNMIMGAQQQHPVSIHHPPNPYAHQYLQHQLMEGHRHQAHQMNLFQQPTNNTQQFPQPIPPPHIPHPNMHFNNSQPFMPFGFNFNSNMSGNVASYNSNQLGNFVHNNFNQLGNHQQAHQHPLQRHPSCFMQQQSFEDSKSSSTVDWMSPQTSTVPISNVTANNYSNMSPRRFTKASASKIPHSALPDLTTMPSGLEHVWKSVPAECQLLLTPQDVPDTARLRGYFTVYELLQLKHALEKRLEYSGITAPKSESAFTKNTSVEKDKEEACEKGPRKGDKSNNSSQVITNVGSPEKANQNGQKHANKQQEQQEKDEDKLSEQNGKENEEENMEQDVEDLKFAEQMHALNTFKSHKILIHEKMPPITGFCVAAGGVTDAMNGLTSEENNVSADPSREDSDETEEESDTDDKEKSGQDQVEKADVPMKNSEDLTQNSTSQREPGIMGEELTVLPSISDTVLKKQLTTESKGIASASAETENKDNKDMTVEEKHKQILSKNPLTAVQATPVATNNGSYNETRTVHINVLGNYHGPTERPSAPSAPFRTVTLVLKLLQIGNYSIRSFSHLNPNRFRVLFNTHRISYECQLPIIRSATPNENPNLRRQILTIDIGFEQVTQLRFGEDSLSMIVEGQPLLTLSYSQALEEPNQVLTPTDQLLMEQIEKSQLKLSPHHQLYFLNERMVRQLESQFREHPRFRRLIYEDESIQRFAQKRMRMF